MPIEIRVPQLPESVADATLVVWRKKPGEAISRDESLADLETDKVVLEVPSPANGVVRELRVETGATVRSGDLLALIDEAAATAVAAPEKEKLSPAVRRMVEENRLDTSAIPASGKDGRLTKSDVVDYLGKQPVPSAAIAPAAAAAAPPPTVAAKSVSAGTRVGRAEQRVAMSRLRQRIAQRLVEAQHNAALLTTFNEVDLTAVGQLRVRYKDRFEKEHGAKLGFTSFFVKASIEALKKFPVMNASVDGTDVIYHEFYDVGVAVSTDRGLVVPVLRDADLMSFADIEKKVVDYGTRARSGGLTLEELTGGTFTITNGGIFGSMMSTPIVNAPQSAILGMHKILERPVAIDGQVVIRPMMYLAVSYDHRIIDGREAVQFLVTIKDCLEDPGRMLIGL